MKTAESKTAATAQHSQASRQAEQPFFQRQLEGGQSAFFGQQTERPTSFFQPKLKIGKPNDHYEQQADAVADKVVAKLNSPTSSPPTPKGSTIDSMTSNGSTIAFSTSNGRTAVQTKGGDGEKEEKLQKKDEDISTLSGGELQRKPIFDSNAEAVQPYIQRKPIFDSAHDDGLQMKSESSDGEGSASPNFESQLSASKGGGTSLPSETQQQMGSAMGADFSGVRVHTGSEASRLSDSIGAQAFTHGNDVYFNEGKYNPSSTEGSHLLAHELTHTVQQGAAVQRKENPVVSETATTSVQKVNAPAKTAKVSSEVVDISKGFNPSDKVKAEIEAEGDKGLDVRIRAGTFAEEGTIKVKKDNKDQYDDKGDGYLALKNDLLTSLGGGYLKVSVKDSQITAYATVGKQGDYKAWVNKLKTAPAAIGLSLKVDKIDAAITNKYEGGTLTLGFTGLDVTLGGFFKVALNLQFENMTKAVFEGSAEMTVKGAKGIVTVDNKKSGKLSGIGSLTIGEFKGFSGAVAVKYDAETGAIDIHGKAAYSGNKLSGSVELVSTDLASANSFAKQAIAEAGGKTNVQEAKAPESVPPIKKEGERALAGVGQLAFNLTTWFAGTVTVIVDGKGDVTVIGKIAPPAEIELFKQKDWDKEIFSLQVEAGYGIPVVGTIGIYAAVSLSAIAKLGPAKLYNIEILGTYSTDPEVQKSIQISASLNISAYAGLRLRAEGGAKLTIVSHDLKIGVGVNADVGVKAYADARPTIGYREPGEFYISGTLDMVAQPMLGLSGDFFIKLDAPWWSPLSDETWTWPIGSKEWPLSDPIGLSADVKEYVLGSGKVPEIEFKKPEFDGSKFMTNMVDKKLPEKSGGAKEGGGTFKEDGSVPKPSADTPAPKKGKGDKDKGKGKTDAKGGTKPPLDPAKGKKDDKAKQKDLEVLKTAGKELEGIKGASLTRAELDKKLNGIKNKAKGVTFNVVAEGDKWAVTPSCNGQTGKVIRFAANLKPEDKKKEDAKKDGKKDDIKNALAEIDTEGKQKMADGEVTKGDAEQIKADVNRDHPSVIEIKSIKESEKTWDFDYVQKNSKTAKIDKEKKEKVDGQLLNNSTIASKSDLTFTKEEPRQGKEILGYKAKVEKSKATFDGIIVGKEENSYVKARKEKGDYVEQFNKLKGLNVESRRKVISSGPIEHTDFKPEKINIQSLGVGKIQVSYHYSKEAHDGGQQDFTVLINLDDVKKRIVTQTIEGKNLALKVPGTRGYTDSAGILAKKDYGIDLNSAHILADRFLGSGYKKALNLILTSEEFNQVTMAKAEDTVTNKIKEKMKINSGKFVTFDMTVSATFEVLPDDLLVETLAKVKSKMSETAKKKTLEALQGKQDPRKCETVVYSAIIKDENNQNLGIVSAQTEHGDKWLSNLFK